MGVRTVVLSLLTACTSIVILGCNAGSDLFEVTGTVSVDGKQPEKGSIAFTPVNGDGPTAGADIVAGKYKSMVPPGKSKVEIRVPKIVGKQKLYDTPDSPVQDIMEEVLPSKFNDQTELTMEVERGTNEKNWDLQTK